MAELKWLFCLLTPYFARLCLAVLLGYLAIATNVGLMGTSGYLIAAAALHPVTILLLWIPIVGVRFFGISRSVFRYLERLVSHDVTFRILAAARVWYYEQLEKSSTPLLQRHCSADLLAGAVTDVESLQNLYLRVVAPPVVALLVGVTAFTLTARYSMTAAVWYGGAYLLTGAVVPWLTWRLGQPAGKTQVTERSNLQTRLGDVLTGMTELLVDGQAERAMAQIEHHQVALDVAFRRGKLIESAATGLFNGLMNLSVWLTLLICIPRVTTHHLPGVQLPSLLFIVLASFEAVTPLPSAVQTLAETLAAARRIREFTSPPTKSEPGVRKRASGEVPADELTSAVPLLECKNLRVRYPQTRQNALDGFILKLTPGQAVAIVGESGCGKSTLVSALLRLTAYEGEICIGETNARDFTESQVRGYFAVVTQHSYLFHVSIADNLRLAKPGATASELQSVMDRAQLTKLVAGLPNGLETFVGEDGTRLSGGERQRLALARALLRNAPILLLDEPIRGLDTETSQRFLNELWTVKGNASLLYFTHQLVGLDRMDTILVMQEGRLIEQGTFPALMAKPQSRFRRMWELEQRRIGIAEPTGTS